jgi:epoxyqueuosine reductase
MSILSPEFAEFGDIWRWKMNVARVMGNTGDNMYIPDLVRAFHENTDDRVRGMALWALGRMGAREVLKDINNEDRTLSDQVALELKSALDIKA